MTDRASTSGSDGAISQVAGFVGRYVNHDDVLIRFVSLWVIVAALFAAAWIVSYYLLPQGCFAAGTRLRRPSTRAAFRENSSRSSRGTWVLPWSPIGANTLRSVDTPLGYVVEIVQAPRYGAVWGTGSLALGSGDRIVPSLSVLVERSGPLEITAIVANYREALAIARITG